MSDRAGSPDPAWQALYRAGAIATVLYVVGLVLVVTTASPPDDPTGAKMLAYVDEHRTLYYIKQLLWLVPSLPLMIVSLALAVAGWERDRSLALIAGTTSVIAWVGSYVWLTSGEGSLAMPLLADGYVAAATDAERVRFVAGAEMLLAINDMATTLGVLQTLGILLLGILMLRSAFAGPLGWFTVGTGAIDMVAEAFRIQLGWAYAIYGLLFFVWPIWVAVVLWRFGKAVQ
jgi:hypothetical protein